MGGLQPIGYIQKMRVNTAEGAQEYLHSHRHQALPTGDEMPAGVPGGGIPGGACGGSSD